MGNIIKFKTEPFEHIIIENTFSDIEYNLIGKELENIYNQDLFTNQTDSARDDFGNSLKTNKSVFLKDLSDYEKSSIYQSKFELSGIIESWFNSAEINKKHWFFYNLKNNYNKIINQMHSLISYYGNDNEYKSHFDYSLLTTLTWYYKEPKKFTGGELVFEEFDNYSIPCEKNHTVIFPSFILHKVNQVKVEEFGYGRFTLTNFLISTGSITV